MSSAYFFGISELSYMLAMIAYISFLAFKRSSIGLTATVITVFGFINQTIAFGMRWWESYQLGIGRAPLTNLYESLIFFVWCLIGGYLIVEFVYKNRTFGAFVTPVAGLALAFIHLTGMSKEIQPLVPALQSNWLLIHVMLTFLSYAAFALSFSTAIMYLIITTKDRKEPAYIFWTASVGIVVTILLAMALDLINEKFLGGVDVHGSLIKDQLFISTFRNPSMGVRVISYLAGAFLVILCWRFGYLLKNMLTFSQQARDLLEEITYKTIAVGFPVFTIGGLIFGAIWADQAWGVYWSWDPKETWSLITWFVYAIYLHARYMRGWRGKKVAILSVIGFVSVIFTYLGVNLLLSGLHSYGSA
jgi:cytochrome c-type biogenesis protein CcsB